VAENAEGGIDAVRNLADGHSDRGHADPTEEEYVKPDVKHEEEVLAVVHFADARIQPYTVFLKLAHALATSLAMV